MFFYGGMQKMTSSHMRRALRLAQRGRYTTSPNPMVGAVIVDAQGVVVGEGYHVKPGGPHAEIIALNKAGDRAKGGTLYVTLEPCNHHGRTPPCTSAITAAGIRQAVVATRDPNPRVSGHGTEYLASHGVNVTVGDGEDEAVTLNRPFFTWSLKQRPFFILKSAMSLDGKVATRTGESRYLTGAPALSIVHNLRRRHDAILVGVGTILADDPSLTYRGHSRGRDPVRVILDSQGRTPSSAQVFGSQSTAPTLVFTTDQAHEDWERAIFSAGGEVIRVDADSNGRVQMNQVATHLADRHILSVLVEGGPTVHATFVENQLADAWVGFVAPLIIGGPALTPVQGEGITQLANAPALTIVRTKLVGADVMIEADFVPSSV